MAKRAIAKIIANLSSVFMWISNKLLLYVSYVVYASFMGQRVCPRTPKTPLLLHFPVTDAATSRLIISLGLPKSKFPAGIDHNILLLTYIRQWNGNTIPQPDTVLFQRHARTHNSGISSQRDVE